MIYLLEDDTSIQKFVSYALKNAGFEVEGFETPSAFWTALKKEKPELLLLDVMLPEEDGITILNKLRSKEDTKKLPVIMLTAKGTEYDRIIGLDSGADDYVAKPFSIMELISRIKAVLRRSGNDEDSKVEEYTAGNITVDVVKHVVKVDGEEVKLTYKEFELLVMLMKHKEKVFGREEILEKVWGYDFDGENRTVDVHIRTLRTKLGDAGNIIETVRGIGYKVVGKSDKKS
ncbi:MAG: response regulator transcription factor [Lachnospiraceae bacterium]|nr:response regulator transcription factor [Lachnospiraceae bacterium]